MIAGMPAEVARTRRLGDKKAEQVEVKVSARFEIIRVEAEVTEATHLERPVQRDAADVVFF